MISKLIKTIVMLSLYKCNVVEKILISHYRKLSLKQYTRPKCQ